MLEKTHIAWYRQDILYAKRIAEGDIETARHIATEVDCEGCDYCKYLDRHQRVLQETTAKLITIVDSLEEGMRSPISFSRVYGRDVMIYRGFITEDGEYLSIWGNLDHDKCWEEYAHTHEKEQAYRLIKVSGSYGINKKAQVIFSDRKSPPSEAQYTMLKNLLVHAEGDLSFRFVYDPSHPH